MRVKRALLNETKELGGNSSKRRRKVSISEDESIASCSKNDDSPSMSKIYNSTCRNNKPAELFRKDLISAMKLPDNEQLDEKDFWYVTDSWKQEWERGVQVPVNSKHVPLPRIRDIKRRVERDPFKLPKKFVKLSQDEFYSTDIHVLSTAPQNAETTCRYDLDDLDLNWLKVLNEKRTSWGFPIVSEETFELIIENLEAQCFNKFQAALKTEEGLGIEYDDDVICDVCRNPDCEEGNEMVFCDICNICVHQACYGITAIPEGSWVCRTCAANVQPSCVLCPNKGGAMKKTSTGNRWSHVSCALWVPEVVIVDPEKMEPIGKISEIPPSRWALICTLCRERVGACIQCCVKQCKVAYHVTCAFENGLEINAIYDEAHPESGVKLKSYCNKHGYQNNQERDAAAGTIWKMKSIKKETKAAKVNDLEKHNARLQKIHEMESEFYKYVNIKQVKLPHVDKDLLDFFYCYWKLKRTANYNKPLIATKLDESALSKQPDDDLYIQLKTFVHVRQDLERVRNLCYMVSRREKLRRTYVKSFREIFTKQEEALKHFPKKQQPKEHESILAASIGDSIYDKLYNRAHFKFTETPVKKDNDDDDGEKKKLASSSRLPNPYAKLYFNGIHTRSRGQTSPVDSGKKDGDNTAEEPKVIFPELVEKPVLPLEKGRRASVPTAAVVKTEPRVLERRTSAHYVERTKVEDVEREPPVLECIIKEKTHQKGHKSMELRGHDVGKENVPASCEDLKKPDLIAETTSLCDLKNSPSQSDKENVVAKPRRGRRPKIQPDTKALELNKISAENFAISPEKLNKIDHLENVVSEDLKTPNLRSSRYEMRSRNNSTSAMQDDSVIEIIAVKSEPVEKSTSSCKADLLEPELALTKDKEIKIVSPKEFHSKKKKKKKVRLKRKTRCRLFKQERSDISRSESSMSEEYEDCELPDLTLGEPTEYKMTLRQNGKVVLSPLRKPTVNSPSSSSVLSVPGKSLKNNVVCNLNHRIRDKVNCESGESPSSSSSTATAPRIVLKLVKDRDRQQWQKHSLTPDEPSTFKVVRNDWELTVDSKDSLLSEELESLAAFIEPCGHRYMMRSRSKQS